MYIKVGKCSEPEWGCSPASTGCICGCAQFCLISTLFTSAFHRISCGSKALCHVMTSSVGEFWDFFFFCGGVELMTLPPGPCFVLFIITSCFGARCLFTFLKKFLDRLSFNHTSTFQLLKSWDHRHVAPCLADCPWPGECIEGIRPTLQSSPPDTAPTF